MNLGTSILRSLWGLLVVGFILGHGVVAIVQSYKFFRLRKESAAYLFFGLLFFAIGITPALLAVAIAQIPPPLPSSARWMFVAALVMLAVGTWPTVFYLEGKRKESDPQVRSGELPPEEWERKFRVLFRDELEEYHSRHYKGAVNEEDLSL